MMVPISSLRPVDLQSLSIGELFTPLYKQDSKFIAGVIGETAVVVMIIGEWAFEADPPERWDSATGWAGWAVKDVRFEVDAESIGLVRTPRPGSLVLSKSGAIFVSAVKDQRSQAVRLDSTEPATVQENDLSFNRWRIVCGPEEAPTELFVCEKS